ncbi:MAG: HD domain-containing protein [Chloroflexota bacterium]
MSSSDEFASAIPLPVWALLRRLWANGHEAYVVGGALRDVVLGRPAADWDLTTEARPDRMLEIFPGAAYENRFGTVAVREGGAVHEITTYRIDHEYADFRRPHRIEFGDAVEDDLARRDFTMNAMAWGAPAPVSLGDGSAADGSVADGSAADGSVADGSAADGSAADAPPDPAPVLVDPFNGRADAAARILRAVGDPGLRFREDALRMVRAIRLAATLPAEIEPATLGAIRENAGLAAHLSKERVAAELDRLLGASRPSVGLRLMAETGLLEVLWPDLAIQRGVPQNKTPGEDLWDHTLRSVDAAPIERPTVRLAALLHDIGKPSSAADGHFHGHETVGAEMARTFLERLRYPRSVVDRVVHLVRQHMFGYEPAWSDVAVRRFIGTVGRDALDDLLDLRTADNVGSGQDPDAGRLAELRVRIVRELQAQVALDLADLAIDGGDLIEQLGLVQGPSIGALLDALLERVVEDPALNDRPTLLLLARRLMDDEP